MTTPLRQKTILDTQIYKKFIKIYKFWCETMQPMRKDIRNTTGATIVNHLNSAIIYMLYSFKNTDLNAKLNYANKCNANIKEVYLLINVLYEADLISKKLFDTMTDFLSNLSRDLTKWLAGILNKIYENKQHTTQQIS